MKLMRLMNHTESAQPESICMFMCTVPKQATKQTCIHASVIDNRETSVVPPACLVL